MSQFEEVTEPIKRSLKKPNKTTLLVLGGFVVLLIVIFQKSRSQSVGTTQDQYIESGAEITGYPQMNPSNLDEQFENFYGQIGAEIESIQTDTILQNKDYTDSILEKIQSEIDKQNDKIDKLTPSNESPTTPTTPKPTSIGVFTTGTFTSQKQAEQMKSMLEKSYGGTNVTVKYENGNYRVSSQFTDKERAQKVSERLKETKKIGVGYVK